MPCSVCNTVCKYAQITPQNAQNEYSSKFTKYLFSSWTLANKLTCYISQYQFVSNILVYMQDHEMVKSPLSHC